MKDTEGRQGSKNIYSREVDNILQRNYKLLNHRSTVTDGKLERVKSHQ